MDMNDYGTSLKMQFVEFWNIKKKINCKPVEQQLMVN